MAMMMASIASSGGKDGKYKLDVFVNRYNLRVVALSFDNAFISSKALVNISNAAGKHYLHFLYRND
jgi:tRNA(Ile)-lysidine synthase TilS/MesJ